MVQISHSIASAQVRDISELHVHIGGSIGVA